MSDASPGSGELPPPSTFGIDDDPAMPPHAGDPSVLVVPPVTPDVSPHDALPGAPSPDDADLSPEERWARLDAGLEGAGVEAEQAPLYTAAHDILRRAGVSIEQVATLSPDQRRQAAHQVANRAHVGRPSSVNTLQQRRDESARHRTVETNADGSPRVDDDGNPVYKVIGTRPDGTPKYEWVNGKTVKELTDNGDKARLAAAKRQVVNTPAKGHAKRRHHKNDAREDESRQLRGRLANLEKTYGHGIGTDHHEPNIPKRDRRGQTRKMYRKTRGEAAGIVKRLGKLEGAATMTDEGVRFVEHGGKTGKYRRKAAQRQARPDRRAMRRIERDAAAHASDEPVRPYATRRRRALRLTGRNSWRVTKFTARNGRDIIKETGRGLHEGGKLISKVAKEKGPQIRASLDARIQRSQAWIDAKMTTDDSSAPATPVETGADAPPPPPLPPPPAPVGERSLGDIAPTFTEEWPAVPDPARPDLKPGKKGREEAEEKAREEAENSTSSHTPNPETGETSPPEGLHDVYATDDSGRQLLLGRVPQLKPGYTDEERDAYYDKINAIRAKYASQQNEEPQTPDQAPANPTEVVDNPDADPTPDIRLHDVYATNKSGVQHWVGRIPELNPGATDVERDEYYRRIQTMQAKFDSQQIGIDQAPADPAEADEPQQPKATGKHQVLVDPKTGQVNMVSPKGYDRSSFRIKPTPRSS